MPLIVKAYEEAIDCNNFRCTADEMTTYLKVRLSHDTKKHICSAYHVFFENELAGYFTISPFSLLKRALPSCHQRGLPCYQDMPMWLLGRLAVDSKFAGGGFGTAVAGKALCIIGHLCHQYGGIGAVVDVLKDNSFERRIHFYEDKLNFKKIPNLASTYFLPLSTIEKLPQFEENIHV